MKLVRDLSKDGSEHTYQSARFRQGHQQLSVSVSVAGRTCQRHRLISMFTGVVWCHYPLSRLISTYVGDNVRKTMYLSTTVDDAEVYWYSMISSSFYPDWRHHLPSWADVWISLACSDVKTLLRISMSGSQDSSMIPEDYYISRHI